MSKVEEISGICETTETSKKSSSSSRIGDTSFESLMDQISQREDLKTQNTSTDLAVSMDLDPTPMELDQTNQNRISPVAENPSDMTQNVINSTQKSCAKIEDLKLTLKKFSDQDLSQYYRQSLRNRLTHIDDKLQITLSIAGSENKLSSPRISLIKPIEDFLGGLSHAQNQMSQLGDHLATMGKRKEALGMTDMMAIQIKVHEVQQQIEFFSATLNQALQGFKSLLQTQI